MNKKYSKNIEEIATFGLDSIDPKETVEVNLKDLLYVYLTLQEFQRFFHQPLHYQSLDDINDFLGSKKGKRGYALLHKAIHNKMVNMLPKYIEDKFSEGDFDSEILPYYYKEKK